MRSTIPVCIFSFGARCCWMTLLSFFLASSAHAQSQAGTGQIVGAVLDTSAAAIPRATVKATNNQTGLVRTVSASSEGLFRIVLLPPGSYNVSADAPGFTAANLKDVEVTVGETTDANLTLGVGAVRQEVTVSASPLGVRTTQDVSDSVINQAAINDLPINGRRFQDFVTLTPTAQVEPRRGQVSLSGQRGINTNTNIDGVDYNQSFFGGIRGGERANNVFTIPQESIKEFQVVAAGYSAEFGRSTGGIVNAVTKSGTNEAHGSAFYLLRHRDFSRKNEFFEAIEKSANQTVHAAPTLQQWGGSVGGPLKKDKAFLFGAYEQQRLRNERQVFFDALAGLPSATATQEAFNFFKSLQVPFTQTDDGEAWFSRFDYNFSEAHRFNVRYNGSRSEAFNANSVGNQLFPTTVSALSNNGTEKDRSNTVVGQLASILNPQLINEVRAQYSRESRPRLSNSSQPSVLTSVGNFGAVTFLPTTEVDWRAQVADALTWTRGNHTLKFGGEYNHLFADQSFGFNQFGAFTILGGTPTRILSILSLGGGTNRFDDSSAIYRRQIGNLLLDFAENELAFFGQDSWRIRPNFTLNYGFRWEGQFNPTPATNNTSLVNKVNGFRFPSGDIVDPTQIPDSLDGFSPRVGFAWDPFKNSKTVVRGFGGIYYGPTPGLLFTGPLNNFRIPAGDLSIQLPLRAPSGNPNTTVYRQLKLIGVDLNTFTLDKLPVLTVDQVQSIAQALGLSSFDPFTGVQPVLVAPDYRNPRSYQWGIGAEREVARGLTIGADFDYVHALRLERNRDLNIPVPVLRSSSVDPAQRPFFGLRSGTARPIPTLGAVQERQTTAKSLYRALVLSAKFRRKWGQFNAYYTLSKTLSDDDNERDAVEFRYDNAFNLSPEYGVSNIDRRHQFLANPVIFLPHGFEVASAIRLLSGRPIDATLGSDINEDFQTNDRPYHSSGVSFQRNEFRNFAVYNVDFRVQKGFSLGESRRLTFSAEFFNIFNLMNIEINPTDSNRFPVTNYCATPVPSNCGFSQPTNPNFLQLRDQNPSSSRLGQLLLTNNPGAPFQMQLGFRFQF